MRRTKIVCTIGPASEDEAILRQMILRGMDVARINFSHVECDQYDWVRALVSRIRDVAAAEGHIVAVLQDLQGPRLRVGGLEVPEVLLEPGRQIILTTRDVPGNADAVHVEYQSLPQDVQPGEVILISDGEIELRVDSITDTDVICSIIDGGILRPHKGINLPGMTISAPTITEKDRRDVQFGVAIGVDFVALSFVRQAADVVTLKKIIAEAGAATPVIAKIEKHEAISNFDDILAASDGIMVARGDLGIEMPSEEVPLLQKMIIAKSRAAAKPVITATQMLESMIASPRPTRAEVSDVANAIFDGTDAVMLSGETAAGKYPVDSVATMSRVAETTEKALPYGEYVASRRLARAATVTDAIAEATCEIAFDLDVKAIITSTASGRTARVVARHRPSAPIFAITPRESTQRQLTLVWGVRPLLAADCNSLDEMINSSVSRVQAESFVADGDMVVITAGVTVGRTGATNLLKVHIVGEDVRM